MNTTFYNITETTSDPVYDDYLGVFVIIILLLSLLICIVCKNKGNCDYDDPYTVTRSRHSIVYRHQPEVLSI